MESKSIWGFFDDAIDKAQKKKDIPEVIKDLNDYMNVQLFSSIKAGSHRQPINVIFDTGSNWLWLASEIC
jgi:hypothetical protein